MTVETVHGSRVDVGARARAPTIREQRSPFPVLDAEAQSNAGRIADTLGRDKPVRTFFGVLLIAYVAIAGASILLGLLLTHVILSWGGLASGDEWFVAWLAHHRSGGLTDASLIGSMIGGGVVLPIVVGVTALAAALVRQWRVAGFLVFVLVLESSAYRATTLAVHRQRPEVHRLEHLSATASYFSGHTAAAIAVYCGIALLLTSRLANRGAKVAIWAVAVAIPVFVALSRMYRGMHHPLDVLGGVLVGIAAVAALVVASRAAGRAAAARNSR
jgi:undecaprenyl-diphosphatase